jgi:hypothetical protein
VLCLSLLLHSLLLLLLLLHSPLLHLLLHLLLLLLHLLHLLLHLLYSLLLKGVIQVLHACFIQSRAILNLDIWDGSALPNLELAQNLSFVCFMRVLGRI